MLLLLAFVLGAPVAAAPDAAPFDVVALEAFVDGVMAAQFEELDLVGAVVTVVQSGGPTFSKGYGYADLESRTPVDPERTLFRIGSVTKFFVWTAVMQLAPLAPAGSMSATGDDMARFMLAHLQGEAHDGGAILRAETVDAMHRTHATQDPRLSGSAHGFIERSFEGRRTIGHGGGIVAFHSLLVLVPDDGLGVFVAYNARAGAEATAAFAADFFAHRYAADAPPVAEPPRHDLHRPDVAGTYRPTRVAHTTLDKLAGLLTAATLTSTDDGGLRARNLGSFGTTRWVPVEHLVYREADGRDLLVFQEDGEGRVVRALLGGQPHVAFERLVWHQSSAFHIGLLGSAVVVLLSAVVGWPLGRWWGRRGTSLGRFARATAWAASAAFLVFLASLAVVLRDPMELAFGVPPVLHAVLVLGLVGTALTIAGAVLAVRAWALGAASVAARVHYSAVVVAGAALVWFLDTWNLLGFRY